MTVNAGDIIRCTQSMLYDNSDRYENVYYYQHQGSGGLADNVVLAGLEGEISGWTGYILGLQVNELVYEGVECYNVTQDTPMGFLADTYSNAGTNAGTALPLQCSMLVTFDSGDKHGQGRKYLAAPAVAAQSDAGILTGAALTALGTWAAAVLGGVSISGEDFVVGHYRKATGAFLDWLSARVDTVIRTQRRRVLGVGS
jgi:hypothetical protein